MSKYKFKEENKHSEDYRFTITEDGHTMMPFDIIMKLNQIEKLREEKEVYAELLYNYATGKIAGRTIVKYVDEQLNNK